MQGPAWLLYAAENNITNFDEIKAAVDQGFFFIKIKIGQPGTQQEMLDKDISRLTEIHQAIGNAVTTYTDNGKLPYYFDANGRYESKETLRGNVFGIND